MRGPGSNGRDRRRTGHDRRDREGAVRISERIVAGREGATSSRRGRDGVSARRVRGIVAACISQRHRADGLAVLQPAAGEGGLSYGRSADGIVEDFARAVCRDGEGAGGNCAGCGGDIHRRRTRAGKDDIPRLRSRSGGCYQSQVNRCACNRARSSHRHIGGVGNPSSGNLET